MFSYCICRCLVLMFGQAPVVALQTLGIKVVQEWASDIASPAKDWVKCNGAVLRAASSAWD